MDRIASFTINHLDLMPGLYVSRRDAKGDCVTGAEVTLAPDVLSPVTNPL